jgi:hypothetical protein
MFNSTRDVSRRELLQNAAGGFGALALAAMMADEAPAIGTATGAPDPLAPKAAHFAAKAKCVIFLYMSGGVSHVDSFDPKPQLVADDGKQMTAAHWRAVKNVAAYVKRPNWNFRPHGACGTEVSELFPAIGSCVDDLCVIRSMNGNHTGHYEATLGIHTGSFNFARPSLGSWVSYGLGTENRNLPSFAVIAPQFPYAGKQAWASDFLPGCHQGTQILPGDTPIANMRHQTVSLDLQEMELEQIDRFNRVHLEQRNAELALEARIRSFETAFGMQREAPDLFDLSRETDATLALYGLQRGQGTGFGWQCLVARRMAERGVRFIELIDTGADSSSNWDSHDNMNAHQPLAQNVDRPIAGLIRDLKSRGMLDSTLVVWTTEFGRTPYNAVPNAGGRDHHHEAFSSFMAGAGVKAGIVHGATDEYGISVVENKVHVHDFHATILHLLGLDHEKLTYRHAGRDFRLTDVAGRVVTEILA